LDKGRVVVDVLNEPVLVFTLVVSTNRLFSRPGLCFHRAAGASVGALYDIDTSPRGPASSVRGHHQAEEAAASDTATTASATSAVPDFAGVWHGGKGKTENTHSSELADVIAVFSVTDMGRSGCHLAVAWSFPKVVDNILRR
jgi:hypothetical protein